MRIIIIGQKWLAAQLLTQCKEDGHEILAAIAPQSTRPPLSGSLQKRRTRL